MKNSPYFIIFKVSGIFLQTYSDFFLVFLYLPNILKKVISLRFFLKSFLMIGKGAFSFSVSFLYSLLLIFFFFFFFIRLFCLILLLFFYSSFSPAMRILKSSHMQFLTRFCFFFNFSFKIKICLRACI